MSPEVKWPNSITDATASFLLNWESIPSDTVPLLWLPLPLLWLLWKKPQLIRCFKHFRKEQMLVSEDLNVDSAYYKYVQIIKHKLGSLVTCKFWLVVLFILLAECPGIPGTGVTGPPGAGWTGPTTGTNHYSWSCHLANGTLVCVL